MPIRISSKSHVAQLPQRPAAERTLGPPAPSRGAPGSPARSSRGLQMQRLFGSYEIRLFRNESTFPTADLSCFLSPQWKREREGPLRRDGGLRTANRCEWACTHVHTRALSETPLRPAPPPTRGERRPPSAPTFTFAFPAGVTDTSPCYEGINLH